MLATAGYDGLRRSARASISCYNHSRYLITKAVAQIADGICFECHQYPDQYPSLQMMPNSRRQSFVFITPAVHTGNRKVKMLPTPGSLAASRVPLWASAMDLQMERPRPELLLPVRDGSAR